MSCEDEKRTMIEISIVMPCYNCEQLITKVINSLLEQSYENFELLCLDDASDDGTLNILQDISKKDKRVTVYKNTGHLGAARLRNIGLKRAIGKYVIFLDSDDFFDKYMLESAYKNATKADADISIFDYVVQKYDGKEATIIYRSEIANSKYATKTFNYNYINDIDIELFCNAAWNKLYKRSFLIHNNLEFQDISSSNDVSFTLKSMLIAKKISVVDSRPYIYVNDHKITNDRISNNRDIINDFLAIKNIFEFASKRNITPKQCELIIFKAVPLLASQFVRGEGTSKYYEFLSTEGINELKRIGGPQLEAELKRLDNPLDNFTLKSFDSRWYENYNSVDIILNNPKNKLWEEFHYYKKIGIVGAGSYGKKLLNAANIMKKTVNCLLDSDPIKTGYLIGKYKVELLTDENVKKNDFIIIAMKEINNDLTDHLKMLNIKYACLNDYLN